MEHLVQNEQSSGNIANYTAAFRANHILHGLDTTSFKDERMSLYVKSLRFQAPLASPKCFIVDIQL